MHFVGKKGESAENQLYFTYDPEIVLACLIGRGMPTGLLA
jgi:hypothetical protein